MLTFGPDVALARQLAGSRILVLNWRDIRHPQAGGAEHYMHEIGRRWAQQGVDVNWFTARPDGQPRHEVLDGMQFFRSGGELSLYPHAALWLSTNRRQFDAIVDCQNGIPFFSPVFVDAEVPIVQVVHHVHQDQFATRFPAPVAALGRFLEGPAARRIYGSRTIAAVSPSTRSELRRRLGFASPIHVVPNGTVDVPVVNGPRDPDPTIVVVSRLVPHKRLDLLLGEVVTAVRRKPRLRVEIIGDGPERRRLQRLISDLGLQKTVTLHGYLPNDTRDNLLARAWLTTSTSIGEGWGCSVIEAAAWGVPCVALRVPGICDSVLHGRTGWLVDRPEALGAALIAALDHLATDDHAMQATARCQDWARCFTWQRSADLLAGVVLEEMARRSSGAERRSARSDITTLARFRRPAEDYRTALRSTDEVVEDGENVSVLLNGCDDSDAVAVLRRIGVFEAEVRLTDRHDVLAGPQADLPGRGDGFALGLAAS
jgi:glycosyltransferase involved in cell wall biosynthesis